MSNMTYLAERRRLEMDAVLKKAGHTVRLGEFETCPSGGTGVDTRRWTVRISMKGLHFRSSITVRVGPQKFETCPDWGARFAPPSPREVGRIGGIVRSGHETAAADPVIAARRQVGRHPLPPLAQHPFGRGLGGKIAQLARVAREIEQLLPGIERVEDVLIARVGQRVPVILGAIAH